MTAAADVISAAMKTGKTLPLSWADALESARLLQSPETAAELEELRESLAEAKRANSELKSQLTGASAAVEYGIRMPDGDVIDASLDRADTVSRLRRYRDSWPGACLMSRPVAHGPWTEVAS
ncbi:hypothetical protein ACFXI8_27180 [Streptomyces niveus]|uniref:hypothetical protein n=1 Tax=Streptomyces niveus TaxID=193462 RepID=UPI003683436D